jgi:DNA-binding NarL/FixJ family response regulator
LTPQERVILALIARGHTNREIAAELVIATSTAERHVANILCKTGARSRTEAAWMLHSGEVCPTCGSAAVPVAEGVR